MKLIKLMTVTALTVGAVFGSFVESAEARILNGYSRRGFDEQNVNGTFFLVDETPDGISITDRTIVKGIDRNPNLGFFKGAIEKFYSYSTINSGSAKNPLDFDEDTLLPRDSEGNIQYPISSGKIEVADLQAQLITREQINLLAQLAGFEVSNEFEGDVIFYSILEQETKTVLNQVVLFTDINILEEVSSNRLTVPFSSDIFKSAEFSELATNSLEDIQSANLLALTFSIGDAQEVLSGGTLSSALSNEEFFFFFDGSIETNVFEPIIVPEYNSTITILGLGLLGVSLGLKRQLKVK